MLFFSVAYRWSHKLDQQKDITRSKQEAFLKSRFLNLNKGIGFDSFERKISDSL